MKKFLKKILKKIKNILNKFYAVSKNQKRRKEK